MDENSNLNWEWSEREILDAAEYCSAGHQYCSENVNTDDRLAECPFAEAHYCCDLDCASVFAEYIMSKHRQPQDEEEQPPEYSFDEIF